MANSIVKSNIDKISRAIVDSDFNLHTWEEIANSGVSIEELPVTLLGGCWGGYAGDEEKTYYTVQSSFFVGEDYNYFMFPNSDTIDDYASAFILCESVSDGSVLLSSSISPENDIEVTFFRVKMIEESPSKLYKVCKGTTNLFFDGNTPECHLDDNYIDIKGSIEDDDTSIILVNMLYNDNNGAGGVKGYLVNRINSTVEESNGGIIQSFLINVDSSDNTYVNLTSNQYRNIWNYIANYNYNPGELGE